MKECKGAQRDDSVSFREDKPSTVSIKTQVFIADL